MARLLWSLYALPVLLLQLRGKALPASQPGTAGSHCPSVGTGWALSIPLSLCLPSRPEAASSPLCVPAVAMVVLGLAWRPCCFGNKGHSLAGSRDPACECLPVSPAGWERWGMLVTTPVLGWCWLRRLPG